MKRLLNELFSDKLKGGVSLVAIVFGVLVLAGSPKTTTAETDAAKRTIVVDPTNHAWDAF
jgi:hypothetical protein